METWRIEAIFIGKHFLSNGRETGEVTEGRPFDDIDMTTGASAVSDAYMFLAVLVLHNWNLT